MEICKNCNEHITGSYCSNCGHPIALKRIDNKYILQEVSSVLLFEKGILHTIKELALRPGKSIKEFLTENRHRLIKPIIFIIITSLIYTVVNNIFNFEDGYINYEEQAENNTTAIFQWISSNYGYANIIMAVFIALWLKLFFKKSPYNFFEVLILLCFLMGMGMLLFSVFGIFESLFQKQLMGYASLIALIYTVWGIGQFYEGKTKFYFKALSAYLLGFMSFSAVALLLGALADLTLK